MPAGTPSTLLSTQNSLLGCLPCAVCSSLCRTSRHQRLFSSLVGKRSQEMDRSPVPGSYLQAAHNGQIYQLQAMLCFQNFEAPASCCKQFHLHTLHPASAAPPPHTHTPFTRCTSAVLPLGCNCQQILQPLLAESCLLLQLSSRHSQLDLELRWHHNLTRPRMKHQALLPAQQAASTCRTQHSTARRVWNSTSMSLAEASVWSGVTALRAERNPHHRKAAPLLNTPPHDQRLCGLCLT